MSEVPSLLPPNSTDAEKALEQATARLADVPAPLRDLWNPATCPVALLPWLAWGLSIDQWDATWGEDQKRAAIAQAIELQRHKGTPASLRMVLDRFDPMIQLVEWFQDPGVMDPYTFRLELPTALESDVEYSDALVEALLQDIYAVKPLRAHMEAVFRLATEARLYLANGAWLAGFVRLEHTLDLGAPDDPVWDSYLQSELGEPLTDESGEFLEEEAA